MISYTIARHVFTQKINPVRRSAAAFPYASLAGSQLQQLLWNVFVL
jgi:hypothetical protein